MADQEQSPKGREIPSIRRVVLNDVSQLPSDYGTTPNGTMFSTTPGGNLHAPSFLLFYNFDFLRHFISLIFENMSIAIECVSRNWCLYHFCLGSDPKWLTICLRPCDFVLIWLNHHFYLRLLFGLALRH